MLCYLQQDSNRAGGKRAIAHADVTSLVVVGLSATGRGAGHKLDLAKGALTVGKNNGLAHIGHYGTTGAGEKHRCAINIVDIARTSGDVEVVSRLGLVGMNRGHFILRLAEKIPRSREENGGQSRKSEFERDRGRRS